MSKSNVTDLLAKIKRHAPESMKEAPAPRPEPKKGKIGKAYQFWLHEEDRKLNREISAWLAGQGHRPTDSMVVRAALRMAKPVNGLLDAYRDASKLDCRIKRD